MFTDHRMKLIAIGAALLCGTAPAAVLAAECTNASQLAIASASDDGMYDDIYAPALAIDGKFQPDSRWSSEGAGKQLVLDMGSSQTVSGIGLAWYKGDERKSTYGVEVSADGDSWTPVIADAQSGGTTSAIERTDFDPVEARYVRVTGQGNEAGGWNSLLEVQLFGCGSAEIAATGDGSDVASAAGKGIHGLRTDAPPSENFDLSMWKLTLPADLDNDGKVDEVEENQLQGWSDERFFYTDPATGGMVFRTVPSGTTTSGSHYARSELREMIRAGDTSISTRNDDGTPNKNNWVFSSAPQDAQDMAGGVDGTLKATLSVNRVTRTGESGKVGRVIIGQIHAKDDEPIRLYYRKLPTNKYGSIYYAHEPVGQDDQYVEIIGDRSSNADNPDDGIALDETFSYEIKVDSEERDGVIHPMLHVSITRDDGTVVEAKPYDMTDSGYSNGTDFMYFKAGAYSQNNSITESPDRDFDQVTFYKLEATHGK
ncbi:polysaccharide lyase family 7 protein [Falsirhodobacter algicola]|uniref:Cyclic nucleotide-binding protein n=1 Tax=Falsirhodobacter algicola TaxID=2692330 RepID=A0A8J8MTU8_9RHOB|nr:polysaccharide lyase family 7 protein [Falsirhodobacter algicola]QUS36334.1 cyclic nucleotide-binding protein [Falsirhodobacter algicola]